MNMRVVLGAGSWGTALAMVVAHNAQVLLWDRNPEVVQALRAKRENARYLPGISLPQNIVFTEDLAHACHSAQDIIIAVPSHAFTEMILQIKSVLGTQACRHKRFLWATKGLEAETGRFLDEVIQTYLGEGSYAVLSGPSFAKEVAQGLPTAVVIAATQISLAIDWGLAFHHDRFRIYTSSDMRGVQLGGVLKNIFAVAAGVCDGLHLGSNARAALITRALAEMNRLGLAMGARSETLMGLSGCGDVILTCTDDQSRNRRLGLALAQGISEHEAQSRIGQAVEAIHNVQTVYQLSIKHQIDMPITRQVSRLLSHQISPQEAVNELFARSLKEE